MSQFEKLVVALLETIDEKNSDVTDSIFESVRALARKKCFKVLSSILGFMSSKKHTEYARVNLLSLTGKLIEENLEQLPQEGLVSWIKYAAKEMTEHANPKEASPNVIKNSSNILVNIGKVYMSPVFEELNSKIVPGQLPQEQVINTLAKLAEINPLGIVVYLNNLMATLLPILGMAKSEAFKCTLSLAFCKFSEAINFYMSNKDKVNISPDNNLNFSTQVYSAYELFVTNWVKSNDSNLRKSAIEAIGQISSLIPADKRDIEIPKIIQLLLASLKKNTDQFVISNAIYLTLDSLLNCEQTSMIESVADVLVKDLFSQVQTLSEPVKNQTPEASVTQLKAKNEILRCFSQITKLKSEKIISFLVQRLEQNSESSRINALVVLKHLINSNEEQFGNKKQIIISGLRSLLIEKNNKVKVQLLQTIMAMTYKDYLGLEGGHLFLEYVVKLCALNTDQAAEKAKNPGPDELTDSQIKQSAENMLTTMSSTMERTHDLLWPYLFEFLNRAEFFIAMSIVCKTLATISEHKFEQAESETVSLINFTENVNIPRQNDLFAILFVYLTNPFASNKRGVHALKLLKNLSTTLDENLYAYWQKLGERLTNYLEEKTGDRNFSNQQWEETVIKFLSGSIDLIKNENKIVEIAESFGKLVESIFSNHPTEKSFAVRCLGIILTKTSNKKAIEKGMNIILNSANHTNQIEKDGVAIGFGFVASTHLDSVLGMLDLNVKSESKKSSSGLFSSFLKSSSSDDENLKSTVALIYAHATLYGPPDLLLSRLESTILRKVCDFAAFNSKDLNYKRNLLKSISIITKCLHFDHLKKEFNFSYKPTLLLETQNYLKVEDPKEKASQELKTICMAIFTNIVRLSPKLSDDEIQKLIQATVTSFTNVFDVAKGEAEPVPFQEFYDGIRLLFTEILSLQNVKSIEFMFNQLKAHILSKNWLLRYQATRLISDLLEHLKSQSKEMVSDMDETFDQIFAFLVPRYGDSNPLVRVQSLQCYDSLYSLMNKDAGDDSTLEQLRSFKTNLAAETADLKIQTILDLSKVLNAGFPSNEASLCSSIIDGLIDSQNQCSIASCVFLNEFIKTRGMSIKNDVPNVVLRLYSKIALTQNDQVRLGILKSIKFLFKINLIEATESFMNYAIPFEKDSKDICKTLCEDNEIVKGILELVLTIWSQCLPYEDKNGVRFVSVRPFKAAYLLNELLQSNTKPNVKNTFQVYFERLYCNIIVRISNTISNQVEIKKPSKPNPKDKKDKDGANDEFNASKAEDKIDFSKLDVHRISVDCLKSLLSATGFTEMIESLDENKSWDMLLDEKTLINGYQLSAKYLAVNSADKVKPIIDLLTQFLESPYECHRILVTAFFAQLVNDESTDLIETLLNCLYSKLIDACIRVRQLCIRGLGNISYGNKKVHGHLTTILSAMIAGFDDKDDPYLEITLESIRGLIKIMEFIQENDIRPMYINILIRVRSFFENDNRNVRESSFELFKKLAKFATQNSKIPYLEQIHSNLTTFVLHLNEEDEGVRKACENLLKDIGELFESKSLQAFLSKSFANMRIFQYDEFLADFSKTVNSEFPDKVSFYIMNCIQQFKNQSVKIRCNAVLLAGNLIASLEVAKQELLSKEHICNALIKLLKEDHSIIVKQKAADAISLLEEF